MSICSYLLYNECKYEKSKVWRSVLWCRKSVILNLTLSKDPEIIQIPLSSIIFLSLVHNWRCYKKSWQDSSIKHTNTDQHNIYFMMKVISQIFYTIVIITSIFILNYSLKVSIYPSKHLIKKSLVSRSNIILSGYIWEPNSFLNHQINTRILKNQKECHNLSNKP